MPRIRKKTSNRVSTNERRKVVNKVRESRKKTKKAAKKNLQWKSKTPKDPGIPNNFPFKEQVLAEVSEQRRTEAEEKQRKKQEKRALRAHVGREESFPSGLDEAVRRTEDMEELTGLQVGNNAIGGVGAKMLRNVQALKPVSAAYEEDEPGNRIPAFIRHTLPTLRAVLEEADIVIEILDARDPLPFRSLHLEELIASMPEKRTILVLNKIDTCPRESIVAWAAYLRAQYPTFLFRSASAFLPPGLDMAIHSKGKGKAKALADDGLGVDSVYAYLGERARAKSDGKPLAVAVIGPTNVGKSSFINSLLRNPVFPIYSMQKLSNGPSTTEVAEETTFEISGKQVKLIDTPGLVWEVDVYAMDAEVRARDILLRNRGRIDRLKDPSITISHIVTQSHAEDLMLLYGLPAFSKGDPRSFLCGVARSHQLVKKRGELDMTGASRIVLRDWSTGKFPRYSVPSKNPAPYTTADCVDDAENLYTDELSVLATSTLKKEMWKNGGLVKVVPGDLESRKAVLDVPWQHLNEEQDDDVNKPTNEGSTDGCSDESFDDPLDSEGDEDDENEDEEEVQDDTKVTQKSLNRVKRKRETTAFCPVKKVTFGSAFEGRNTGSRKAKLFSQTTSVQPSVQKRNSVLIKERNIDHATTQRTRAQKADDVYKFSAFF